MRALEVNGLQRKSNHAGLLGQRFHSDAMIANPRPARAASMQTLNKHDRQNVAAEYDATCLANGIRADVLAQQLTGQSELSRAAFISRLLKRPGSKHQMLDDRCRRNSPLTSLEHC